MMCLECGGNYIKKIGTLKEKDKVVGEYEIYNAEYYECDKCKDKMYPLKTAQLLDKKREEIKTAK